MVLAHLGLGANLGDPPAAIASAIELLGEVGTVLRRARLYRTSPVGPQNQPHFVNTVVEIHTEESAEALLARCKGIERRLGRVPSVRWGPRLIDIDVLLFDDLRLGSAALTLPHPEIQRRRFVLEPLAELIPDRVVPGIDRTIQVLRDALRANGETVRPLSLELTSRQGASNVLCNAEVSLRRPSSADTSGMPH